MHPTGLLNQLQTGISRIKGQQKRETGDALGRQKHDGNIAKTGTGRGSRPENQSQGSEEGNQQQD